MKFTNKLGSYTVVGEALENYKKMQCKPAYRRYKTRLQILCGENGIELIEPIPFDVFCSLHIKKTAQQLKLIF